MYIRRKTTTKNKILASPDFKKKFVWTSVSLITSRGVIRLTLAKGGRFWLVQEYDYS